MFRNWCHFPKFMFSENVTCVKTEGGAVIQTSFSDNTNVLAMTTILFRMRCSLWISIKVMSTIKDFCDHILQANIVDGTL